MAGGSPAEAEPTPTPPGIAARANGPIYFRVWGGDGPITEIVCGVFSADAVAAPVWSSDGSFIAYMASSQGSGSAGHNTGTFDVYTSRPDGTEVTRITTDAEGAGGSLTWQPLAHGVDVSAAP